MDDLQAIARLKQGDITGLEALVLTYQRQAISTAYLITRDRPLAEDIVQAAFLRVYERISQFDSRRPFGPWFLRSVVNDAIKAATRQTRLVSLENVTSHEADAPTALPSDPSAEAIELLERAETHEAVRSALDQLTPAQRTVIVQRYYLGMSEAEMATALARPTGTIKSRLSAAQKQLRYLLSSFGPRTPGSES